MLTVLNAPLILSLGSLICEYLFKSISGLLGVQHSLAAAAKKKFPDIHRKADV